MKWNDRLRKAREDMLPRMGKSAFARAVGVSAATVTNWENGKVESIKGENLMRVCQVIGRTESWLMDGKTEAAANDAHQKLTMALDVKCETAAELRLISAYRLANDRERRAIDHAVDVIIDRLPGTGSNESQSGNHRPR